MITLLDVTPLVVPPLTVRLLTEALVAKTTLPLPVAVLKSVRPASHDASVVPDVDMQVHITVTCEGTVITVFEPDDKTANEPVLLLQIWNVQPLDSVLTTGNATFWFCVPVNNW